MARPEVTGKKTNATDIADTVKKTPAPPELDAFSIEGFCLRHSLSVPLFYKFREDMPETFNVGARVLISKEAAARWRAKREADAAAKAEAE